MVYTREAGRRFWYDFDFQTKYNETTFWPLAGKAGASDIQDVFAVSRENGTPHLFTDFVHRRQDAWRGIAELQRRIFDAHFPQDFDGLQAAFEDFGQGVLYDADPLRAQNDDMIHTMDVQSGSPPIGYHRWHASIRAIESLDNQDLAWLRQLDQFIALAWGIQSFARPVQQTQPNPDVTTADLTALRTAWLALSPDALDRQYDLTGTSGYHPDPMRPH